MLDLTAWQDSNQVKELMLVLTKGREVLFIHHHNIDQSLLCLQDFNVADLLRYLIRDADKDLSEADVEVVALLTCCSLTRTHPGNVEQGAQD